MTEKPANRAIFLDRDGTMARDVRYCRRPEDFEILPGVPEAVKRFNDAGFIVVVVTNQSGLARGYFSREDLDAIHHKMKSELGRHGATIDGVETCPHHPDERCPCRKPGTLLFHEAARKHAIDLSKSYVVGDMALDIQAGKALGCRTVLVTTGLEPDNGFSAGPDFIAGGLLEAARWIVKQVAGSSSVS